MREGPERRAQLRKVFVLFCFVRGQLNISTDSVEEVSREEEVDIQKKEWISKQKRKKVEGKKLGELMPRNEGFSSLRGIQKKKIH